jgi:CO/xanthine dehydrogenase Mo-binding subunit
MAETQFIGKPTNRVDALEKVLGTAKYIGDYRLPGMLLARTLRSPLPHARIVSIDLSAALAVPGVVAAITCEDFVEHGRFGFPVADMFMLAYQRVRYVGDGVVTLAAENEAALQAGLAAILIEYEELPGVFDPQAALNPAAPIIGENPWDAPALPRGNLLTQYTVRKGHPATELAQSAVTFEADYSTMHQEHAYIETEGALAVPSPAGSVWQDKNLSPGLSPKGKGSRGEMPISAAFAAEIGISPAESSPFPEGKGGGGIGSSGVTVYAPCQSPFLNRANLMRTLGLGEDDVRVIQPPVGGAFGGKDDLMYQISGQVAKLALITGHPVRMTLPREESLIASYKRDAMRVHIQLGADANGKLRASQIHAVVDSGAYASITPFTAWRSSIHAMGPYRYDACHVDTDVAYTNNGYSGAFRGFGNTEVCAAIEQAIDELALKLGKDPIDLRLQNCLRPGDTTPHGQQLGDDVSLAECLEQVRKLSDWDRKRAAYSQQSTGDLRRGLGVAAVFHGMSLGAEGADFAAGSLTVNPDYSLTLTSGLTDYGTGSRTVFTLIAAETLGLNPERIRMPRPDTDLTLDSGPTVASRATVLGGNATRVTAQRLDGLLTQAAADLLGCEAGQVVRHAENYIGPAEEPVSFEQVVDHARRIGLTLSSRGRWNSPENHWSFDEGRGKPYFAYHFGAQVAEVLVDTGTGKVEVSGIWAAHNTGTVIFPQGAYGQLYGGITQGLGYALMERVDYDNGYIQATNFDEYLIPTALDVPDIVGAFVEKPFAAGPYGAKNLGEPGMVPTAPAILNAIFHACGQRVRNLPANLERVLIGKDLRKEGSNAACKLGLRLS